MQDKANRWSWQEASRRVEFQVERIMWNCEKRWALPDYSPGVLLSVQVYCMAERTQNDVETAKLIIEYEKVHGDNRPKWQWQQQAEHCRRLQEWGETSYNKTVGSEK